MTIIELITNAKKKVSIKKTIIWNPNTSRALYVGLIENIPKLLHNKEVSTYFYNKEKERIIIRV